MVRQDTRAPCARWPGPAPCALRPVAWPSALRSRASALRPVACAHGPAPSTHPRAPSALDPSPSAQRPRPIPERPAPCGQRPAASALRPAPCGLALRPAPWPCAHGPDCCEKTTKSRTVAKNLQNPRAFLPGGCLRQIQGRNHRGATGGKKANFGKPIPFQFSGRAGENLSGSTPPVRRPGRDPVLWWGPG